MIALCQIRTLPHYRRDAFESGLRRAGYSLVNSGHPAGPEDLLVIWNRYGPQDAMANTWERLGGTVLVCENGYIGKDEQGRQYYAISVHGHNGSGWFPIGTEDRFGKLGISISPWLEQGRHVVVRGQRGIGTKEMASPCNWHNEIGIKLRRLTDRPVKVVEHPGNVEDRSGSQHLVDAWACVIWCSGMGVYALTAGVPVAYGAPHWICEDAGWPLDDWMKGGEAGMTLARSLMLGHLAPDMRAKALHKMAWGQRSVAEIESGEPFATIREHISECPKW